MSSQASNQPSLHRLCTQPHLEQIKASKTDWEMVLTPASRLLPTCSTSLTGNRTKPYHRCIIGENGQNLNSLAVLVFFNSELTPLVYQTGLPTELPAVSARIIFTTDLHMLSSLQFKLTHQQAPTGNDWAELTGSSNWFRVWVAQRSSSREAEYASAFE